MADEFKLRRDSSRGIKAQALLNNELFKETLQALEQQYTEAMFETANNDVQGRERYWQAVHIVRFVRDHLAKVAQHGRVADHELQVLAQGNFNSSR